MSDETIYNRGPAGMLGAAMDNANSTWRAAGGASLGFGRPLTVLEELRQRHADAGKKLERLAKQTAETEIEYDQCARAIAALEAQAPPLDELRTVPPATVEKSGDQIGAPIERPWTLASAFYDGYKGRKHVAPHHPVYMEQWLLGDSTRNELTAEAVERAHAKLDEIEAVSREHDWTPTRPDAEITVADLDKLETKATAEERAGLEIPEGFTKWTERQIYPAETMLEYWWSDGKRFVARADKEWTEPPDAYRIISTPDAEQPEQDAGGDAAFGGLTEMEMDYLLSFCGLRGPKPWGAAMSAIMEQLAGLGMIAGESDATPTEAGRKLAERFAQAGVPSADPTPYDAAVQKGAITQDEANLLAEAKADLARDEQAKFFAEGMMADADRHAQDQRSIVEKIGGVLGFKQKVDA